MHRFELSPNCSLTSRAAALFYLSVVVACLPVAIACAVAGAWMVLPFAGLELAGLGFALWLSLRRGEVRERLRIDADEVLVGREDPVRSVERRYSRSRACVELAVARSRHWPSRLLIGTRGDATEIGAFLTESERRRLMRRLAEILPTARMLND